MTLDDAIDSIRDHGGSKNVTWFLPNGTRTQHVESLTLVNGVQAQCTDGKNVVFRGDEVRIAGSLSSHHDESPRLRQIEAAYGAPLPC